MILRVDSGADHPGSASRRLADELLQRIAGPDDQIVRRHAIEGLPIVTGAWVAAAFSDGDRAALEMSEALVEELLAADELVLVAPVYNFGVPAAMKAWVDQVVRAGRTFRFGEDGTPVGLLTTKRAWIVSASGSTQIGSEYDFNTTDLRAILGFIGVRDIRVIGAMGLQVHGAAALTDAIAQLATVDA